MSEWGDKYHRGEITVHEYWAAIRAEAHEANLRRRELDRKYPEAARQRREGAARAAREAAEAHRRMYPERYSRPWWRFWGNS